MGAIVSSSPRQSTSSVEICMITTMETSTSLDIRAILRGISIFNSLDSMVTSGYVDVLDQGNAISEYSFNGKEIIDIKILLAKDTSTGSSTAETDFNSYSRRFLVYAIDSIGVAKDQMTYRIRFIDPFAMLNTDNRISWHFKQAKGEDIIKKIQSLSQHSINRIYQDAMKTQYSKSAINSSQELFNFKADTSTKHEFDVYVPMMKPLELIRWVTDRCVSQNSPCKWSDCLFYQSKDGVFHFNSFINLFSTDSLVFSQQIAESASSEKQHLIESYTFNKIYNTQIDKLNGIYGLQFAIADFKPTTKTVTQSTVLGTTIASNDSLPGSKGDGNKMQLHESIKEYFRQVSNKNKSSSINSDGKNGFIRPFQCNSMTVQSTQTAGPNGQAIHSSYDTSTGSLIFMDTCGVVHEDDKTYNEYERVTFPYVTGCIMKKVLSTYVINITMNGAFDVDVGRSFTVKLDETNKERVTRQMMCFINGIIWLVSDVKHEWRSDTNQVKTYVTGFTPFIKQGEQYTVK